MGGTVSRNPWGADSGHRKPVRTGILLAWRLCNTYPSEHQRPGMAGAVGRPGSCLLNRAFISNILCGLIERPWRSHQLYSRDQPAVISSRS